MPEIYYVQRGRKKYAYRSTSVYQPGSRYPKTVNEYLGVLDEETGKIIPKKNRASSDNSIDSDTISGKRLGGSWFLLDLAERIGLREDLFRSYGLEGDPILACAIAQALSGGPFTDVEDTMEGTMARELMGIRKRFTSPRMSETARVLGTGFHNLEDLFGRRLARAGGSLSYDLTSVSTHSDLDGWGEWGYNRDGEPMKQMNIGLVTDRRGIPAMFEMYPGSVSDVSTLERTVDRVKDMGKGDCVMVMDRIFGSAGNLDYMLANGYSFVMPGRKNTRCVKALMSRLVKQRHDSALWRMYGGTVYSVLETEIAIVPKRKPSDEDDDTNDTREYELILDEDERFSHVPEDMRMRAYACYDSRKSAEDLNTLIGALDGIEKRLRKMDPYAAVSGLKKVAGGYAKYFDLSVADGELIVRRKNNALSFAFNRGGMFVMFSNGVDSWEDMMACYDCRTYVEQAFDALKNELDGNRWRVGDPETARGRLVIKFVSLILWCTIAAELRREKKPEPVRAVLQSLDNILAIGSGKRWRVLEITKKNRGLMDMFGIKAPDKFVEIGDGDYIPESIRREVMGDLQ
jgi:transposase